MYSSLAYPTSAALLESCLGSVCVIFLGDGQYIMPVEADTILESRQMTTTESPVIMRNSFLSVVTSPVLDNLSLTQNDIRLVVREMRIYMHSC